MSIVLIAGKVSLKIIFFLLVTLTVNGAVVLLSLILFEPINEQSSFFEISEAAGYEGNPVLMVFFNLCADSFVSTTKVIDLCYLMSLLALF